MTVAEEKELIEFVKSNQDYIKLFAKLYDIGFNTRAKLNKAIKIISKYNSFEAVPFLKNILEDHSPADLSYNPYSGFLVDADAVEIAR